MKLILHRFLSRTAGNNTLSDAYLEWLTEATHCTSIKLPIGCYILGPKLCSRAPLFPSVRPYQHKVNGPEISAESE